MKRYVTIHGHFYQPPRENPWLETVERQETAYPYHDWNERITAECYAPNAASRILDADDRILKIVNNYSQISFNFGPTLLTWLQTHAADTYDAILQADRASVLRFSGHGSALAQAYNHLIMPLANAADRRTQVIWGIRDFRRRFGREPEGMWLPETAVDLATLDALAEHGIRFTILAPHQAARVRPLGGRWQELGSARIDPTHPYLQKLPSGREIVLFFYDGPVARAVAFEGLLKNGEYFAQRLMEIHGERADSQLVHIATDGETYGHHHRHGDMALGYALYHIENRGLAEITNYGEFLERYPPNHEVEIIENTSWSCAHGIERWRSNCGCHTGGADHWNQEWRAPLRSALDWLRDGLIPLYERHASELLRDPWAARNDYIDVVLDRSRESIAAFLSRHATRSLSASDQVRALKLLELQRHAMLMYTSCGWFFNDLAGIETVQVIQYAGRAVQLAEELFETHCTSPFLGRLQQARSNLPAEGTGRDIFQKHVRRATVDLFKIGAHYAVSALYQEYQQEETIYCYDVDLEDRENMTSGEARLVVGRARITSEITLESVLATFAVLYFGDHHVHGGVARTQEGQDGYPRLLSDLKMAFFDRDFPAVIRRMDERFGGDTFSIRSLFPDSQRRVLDLILESTLAQAGSVYRQLYEQHAPLMRFLSDIDQPTPAAFRAAAEYVLNADLKRVLTEQPVDLQRVTRVLDQVRSSQVKLDTRALTLTFQHSLEQLAVCLWQNPDNLKTLRVLEDLARIATLTVGEVDLWKVQNLYFDLMKAHYPWKQRAAQRGDDDAATWVNSFRRLGDQLSVSISG
jgi:alpha-amylase/alpha-mannosidase (GH57 family)